MAGEQIKKEDPIEPISIQGFVNSSFLMLHIFKRRPAPYISFTTAMIMWAGVIYSLTNDELEPGTPVWSSGLSFDNILDPFNADIKAWLLHPFVVLSFTRAALLGTMFLVIGYCYEFELGMIPFFILFSIFHFGVAAAILWLGLTDSYCGLEYTLVALAPIFHFRNPILRSDGMGKELRVPFGIQPRWHYWILVFVQMLTLDDELWTPNNVTAYFIAMFAGSLVIFREPLMWKNAPPNFLIMKLILFTLTCVFLPITTPSIWEFKGPSLFGLISARSIDYGTFWIVKALISFLPLALLGNRYIPGIISGIYAVGCGLLVMHAMNIPVWSAPGPAFWALMGMGFFFTRY